MMQTVRIVDVKVPFWSILVLVFKVSVASLLLSAMVGGLLMFATMLSALIVH